MAFLPFVGPGFSCISRVLLLHNIKTLGLPPKKVSSFLQPIEDALVLKTLGIYEGTPKSFQTESIMKYKLTTINTH